MRLPLLPSGVALKLAQADGVLGGKIWPSATALCNYMANMRCDLGSHVTSKLDCVELGSGTGAVGLYAAATLGCNVTLTEHRPPRASVITSVAYSADGMPEALWEDAPDQHSDRLLDLLQLNVDQNIELFQEHNNIPKIVELDWNNKRHAQQVMASASKSHQGFDLILASDVTYVSQLHQALADTIASLLLKPRQRQTSEKDDLSSTTNKLSQSTMPPKCLVAHQERVLNLKGLDFQLLEFERAIEQAGLAIVQRQSCPVSEGSTTHKVSILELQHQAGAKPSSLLAY